MGKEGIIRGSEVGYDKFLRSLIWQDLCAELKVWKKLAESEFQGADSMEGVARIQGRIEAIEYLLALPEILLEALKNNGEEE